MRLWHRWLWAPLVAPLLLACDQDIGGRCQVNSDCASGNCVVRSDNRLVGGFCEPAGEPADASAAEEDEAANAVIGADSEHAS